jgi:rod shape-determining protein MreD
MHTKNLTLARRNKTIAFLIALAAFLFMSPLFPSARLIYFAPFLVIVYYQYEFTASLWASLCCGLLVDIFSSNAFFVTNTIAYCTTTVLLWNQRRHFFSDRLMTLPLMTYFFSLISSLVAFLTANVLLGNIHLTRSFIYSDILVMPLVDSLYGFIFFIVPFLIPNKYNT